MPLPVPGPVFDAFWRFAAERHETYLRRVSGTPSPWSNDPVLGKYKFTNVFRVLDRTSQALVRDVINPGPSDADNVVLRILLFKLFNLESTWRRIVAECGEPTAASFAPTAIATALQETVASGQRIYSPAYIMPPVPGARGPKYLGHLRMLEEILESGLPNRIASAGSLDHVYRHLSALPGLGRFLAFQYTIDLNYSRLLPFSEADFVVAGPGAVDGMAKCFPGARGSAAEQVIYEVTRQQDEWFSRLGLVAPRLYGRRLQPIDIQNVFCEISKYSRVAFPNVRGMSNRTRIKQSFTASGSLAPTVVPVKWGLPSGDQ